MGKTLTADGRDKWLVPSASQAAPRVVIRFRGVLTCDCPAGVRGKGCRHVLAVQTLLAADAAATVAARRALVPEGVAMLLGVAKAGRS